jgi:hypothetical protein
MTPITNNSDFQQTTAHLFAERDKAYEEKISPKNEPIKNYVGLYDMENSSQEFRFRLNKQTKYSWQENGVSVPNFYQYVENLLGLFYDCRDSAIIAYTTEHGSFLLPLLQEAPSMIDTNFKKPTLKLELYTDPEEGINTLFLVIYTSLPTSEAFRILRQLFKTWDKLKDKKNTKYLSIITRSL